ncbi:MAG: alpha-L-fucosidase [Phycisphaerales bacterium]|nr:alpha-L-fucosidase [Phycisphaerales bacterium]
MNMKRKLAWASVGSVLVCGHGPACAIEPEWQGQSQAVAGAQRSPDPRLDWWRQARFGMFIHWGLYAVPAGEWKGKATYGEWIMNHAQIPVEEYEHFRERFNPVKFDADAWARTAKKAGMGYIVITTKHHDGFCLFDSALTDYDVMSTPFKRDVMKELAAACGRAGVRLGWYHSIMDWHHPDYLPRREWESRPAEGADFDRYVAYMKGQLRELLTGYGPIGVLWFDGQWEGTWSDERGRDLYAYVRSLQPDIIVNNRVGRAGGDFGLDHESGMVGDFGTPEQQIPDTGIPGADWETCMTMNGHWGYNAADKDFKSTEDLIRKLADIASKGGNFLLNVGPTAEGLIPAESVQQLGDIGAWMKDNGESIHGTSASPFDAPAWGRCTQRTLEDGNTRLYLHVFAWPADGQLKLNVGLLNSIRGAPRLLADPNRPVSISGAGDDRVIRLNGPAPDPIDSVIALDIDGAPDVAVPARISADTEIFTDTLDVRAATTQHNAELRYTTDGSEPTADSPLVSGPIRISNSTWVKAQAFRGGKAVGKVGGGMFKKIQPRPAEAVADVKPGLWYEYFEGDFKSTEDFSTLAPLSRGACDGFDRSVRRRDTRFGLRFTGFVRVPATGPYRFFTKSDDGSQLFIGDRLVVQNDGPHSLHEEGGEVALAAGLHPITVTFFENTGGHDLQVLWAGPGLKKQPVPSEVLLHKE